MTARQSLDLGIAIQILIRRRRFCMQVLAAFLVLGVVLSFVLPPTYRAAAVIMAPVETDVLGSLQNAHRALSSFSAFGLLAQTYTPADEYQAILKSETIHRAVAARLNLNSVYHTRNMDLTVRALRQHVRVNLSADGSISVSVEDRDPVRAAALANAFPEELDRFNHMRIGARARAQAAFLQTRIDSTHAALTWMEDALRRFSEREHAPMMSGDERAAADGAAALLSRKAALQVRRQILGAYLEPGSDELLQVDQELASLNAEISRLPALELEGSRLVRDLKVQEELLVLLQSQLEENRLRESLNVPTVEYLDRAHPPDVRSSPIRKLVVGAALLMGLVFALAGSLILEAREGQPAVFARGL